MILCPHVVLLWDGSCYISILRVFSLPFFSFFFIFIIPVSNSCIQSWTRICWDGYNGNTNGKAFKSGAALVLLQGAVQAGFMLPAVDGGALILALLARHLMGFNGNIEKSGK